MKTFVPADFHMHEFTLLLWPYGEEYWRLNSEPIQQFYIDYVKAIMEFEPVVLGVIKSEIENVRQLFPQGVEIVEMAYDDVYVRDTAPTLYFRDGIKYGVEWTFNGWGGFEKGICSSWEKDNRVSNQIISHLNIKSVLSDIVLEGGGLLFDGKDTLMVVKETVINPNRNPSLTQFEMTEYFKQSLPIEHVIWINKGLAKDETDGHIDNICAYINDRELFLAWTDDPLSPQFDIVRNAEAIILNHYNQIDREILIHKLPIPKVKPRSKSECEGIVIEADYERYQNELLLGSYLNFIYVNHGVILPVFDCEDDQEAIEIFTKVFKERKVVTLDTRELILGGGSLHCSSFHNFK